MAKGKNPNSDDMTPFQRLEKAKKLEGDSVTYKVLIPLDESTNTYTLGPIFNQLCPTYDKWFPNHNEEPLRFTRSNIMDSWAKSTPVRSWPIPSQDYLSWIDRVEAQYSELWRELGIFDLIQFSRSRIQHHNNLLASALCFWSRTSNCFLFRSAMMTITLYDLGVMFSIPPYGEEISALLEADIGLIDISFEKNDLNYGTFIRLNKGPTSKVCRTEHVAFLLYWLCKFVFCTASVKVVKEHLKIAVALADGRKLALGPCILAHLYRGIFDLLPTSTTDIFSNSGGPLWILQFWLLAYFPEIRYSIPMPRAQTLPNYGQYIKFFAPKFTDFKSLLSFFYKCVSRPSNLLCPFRPARFGPSWAFFSYDAYKPSCDNLDDLNSWIEAWRSILIARDLNFGSVLGPRNNKCGVETYNPHFAARQFGLVQSVPYPTMFSANSAFHQRTVFTSLEDVEETCQFLSLLAEDLVLVDFAVNPSTSPLFDSWWQNYVEKHMTEPFSLVLDGQSFGHSDNEYSQETQKAKSAFPPQVDLMQHTSEAAKKLKEPIPHPISNIASPKKKAKIKESTTIVSSGFGVSKVKMKAAKKGLTPLNIEQNVGVGSLTKSFTNKGQTTPKPCEGAISRSSSKQPPTVLEESSLPDTIDHMLEYLEKLKASPSSSATLSRETIVESLEAEAPLSEDELKVVLKNISEALSVGPAIFLDQEAYKELKNDLQKISNIDSKEILSIDQKVVLNAFLKELDVLSVRYTTAKNLLSNVSTKRQAQEAAKEAFEVKVAMLKGIKIQSGKIQERIQVLEAELAILKGEQDSLLAETKTCGKIAEENIMLSKSLMEDLQKLQPKEEAAKKDLADVSYAFETLKSSLL